MSKYTINKNDELMHYGVLGMHWGIRRYQPYSTTGPRKGGKTGKELGEAAKARARYIKEKAREYKLKRREKNIERYNRKRTKRLEDQEYRRKIGKKPKNFEDWTNDELAEYITKENLVADAQMAKNKHSRAVRERIDKPRSYVDMLSNYVNTGSKILDNIDSFEKSYKKIKKLLNGEKSISDTFKDEIERKLRNAYDKSGSLSKIDWNSLNLEEDNDILANLVALENKGNRKNKKKKRRYYDDDDDDD